MTRQAMTRQAMTHRRGAPGIAAVLVVLAWFAPDPGAAAAGQPTRPPEERRADPQPPAEQQEPGDPPASEADAEPPRFTEEVVVVGTRATPRSVVESAAPIDAIRPEDLLNQGPPSIYERLRAVVPSFAVNIQPISDASTLVRPAMLRNLAPDHTLVLINGKRRHRSAVVDWNGGNGVSFGSQGPDLAAIPSIALRRVEVLRDGATAQYGSDAIAGVINFLLRDDRSGGTVEFLSGVHGEAWDGETWNFAGNVGLPLGAAGFGNLSLEYGGAAPTDRGVQRSDVADLIAAGNRNVQDPAQVWGSPDVDGDLKLFGNFGHLFHGGVQLYGHAGYASRTVSGSFFFRNPNTRGGVFSADGGQTLLVGDAPAAEGAGSANCPVVRVVDHVPDPDALARVFADEQCFSFQERFPGGFTPTFGGSATDAAVVAGVRRLNPGGVTWDASVSIGAHRAAFFLEDTVNASLGPATPTDFDLGANRQREIALNVDATRPLGERVHLAGGLEWRREQYGIEEGEPDSWEVGPYAAQGFGAGSNGYGGYGPIAAGNWRRDSAAAYGDVELTGEGGRWLIGGALRAERFQDFGNTVNGKLAGRYRVSRGLSLRASVGTGFRAPTPGQQNSFNVSTKFDPVLRDLTERGTIPSTSPVAELRGGGPLAPETSKHTSAGAVVEHGRLALTADVFRVDLEDRLAVTSDFTLRPEEVEQLLAAGVDNARGLASFRFFTNGVATRTQGVDIVSTWTPRALGGGTRISAALNHTSTVVTRFDPQMLDAERRVREFESSLPRNRWNVSVTSRVGFAEILGRVGYYGAWFDWDSAQTLFGGKPVADVEISLPVSGRIALALGAQNVFNTFSAESPNARDVGERYSEYTPWGFNGVFLYARVRYTWDG